MIDSEWIDGIYIGAEQLTNDSILGTLSYAPVVSSMNHRMSFCLVHDFSYIFDTEIGMNHDKYFKPSQELQNSCITPIVTYKTCILIASSKSIYSNHSEHGCIKDKLPYTNQD